MIKQILITVGWILFFILIIAFARWDLNPNNWPTQVRSIISVLSVLTVIHNVSIYNKNKGVKNEDKTNNL